MTVVRIPSFGKELAASAIGTEYEGTPDKTNLGFGDGHVQALDPLNTIGSVNMWCTKGSSTLPANIQLMMAKARRYILTGNYTD